MRRDEQDRADAARRDGTTITPGVSGEEPVTTTMARMDAAPAATKTREPADAAARAIAVGAPEAAIAPANA